MIIKPSPINVPPEDPFAEDKLARREHAEFLEQMLGNIQEPLVMAVDAPWGSGKTTFILMLKAFLEQKEFRCLYFNAWETDFTDNPLVSFIGEMSTGIDLNNLGGKNKTNAQEYLNKAKEYGADIVKRTLPLGLKLLTSGVVNLDSSAEQALSDFTKNLAQDAIAEYEADKSTINKFKEKLESFVNELRISQGESPKPLIFFIDELDRCRPIYAIELLEKIKHLFNIKGIIFVLALDKIQLKHSIKSVYGIGMNVDGYLKRLIDLDFNLPKPSSKQYSPFLFERMNLLEVFQGRSTSEGHPNAIKNQMLDMFAWFVDIFNFSLRDQEHCFYLLKLAIWSTPKENYIYGPYLIALISLKIHNPDLYRNLVEGMIPVNNVVKYLGESAVGKEFLSDTFGIDLEAFFLASRVNGNDHNEKNEKIREDKKLYDYYKNMAQHNKSDPTSNKREKTIVYILDSKEYGQNNWGGAIDYLAKKIELCEKLF